MNTEIHEKDYDYVTLIKNHSELFTYDPQNDIYHCEKYNLSIGNKNALQRHIERTCKSNEKEKVGSLFNSYKRDEWMAAVYNKDKSRCNVLPLATALEGRKILEQLQQERDTRMQDKFTAGTVEAQYDNYLSVEEDVDLHEAKSATDKPLEDIDLEME